MSETPTCAYCDATEGLRQHHDGGGYIAPDYVCEDCFTGTDTGPSFDDLPLAPVHIPIERLTSGLRVMIPEFGDAEVYGVRWDGEGYAVDFCTNDKGGWDALDTHYVNAGETLEYSGIGEPPYLRSKAAVEPEEWEAKFQATLREISRLVDVHQIAAE